MDTGIFSGIAKDLIGLVKRNNRMTRFVDESETAQPLFEARIEYVDDNKIQVLDDNIIEIIDVDDLRKHNTFIPIYGVDSSTRTITSPFFFMGMGFGVGVNYRYGDKVECPSIMGIIGKDPVLCQDCKWMVIIPFSGPDDIILKNPCVMTHNPAGTPYDETYNRYVALDELRLVIENHVLSMILMNTSSGSGSVVFLDGPIYIVPKLASMYSSLKPPSRGRVDDYIASWKALIKERLEILRHKKKNTLVYGIVKRLENSYILSCVDPAGLTGGAKINDQAYLILYTRSVFKNVSAKPFIIGPIKIGAPQELADIPPKIVYYIGLPRHRYAINTGVAPYGFYRVEFLEHDLSFILKTYDHPCTPSLIDSLLSGTVIPLSILIADKLAKDVSRGITNYFIRLLEDNGVPLTYDSMRSIEGYFIG